MSYDAVFSDNVDDSDIIHQALDYLVSNNYMLDFNSTQISDLLMIAYPGVFSSGGKCFVVTNYEMSAYG